MSGISISFGIASCLSVTPITHQTMSKSMFPGHCLNPQHIPQSNFSAVPFMHGKLLLCCQIVVVARKSDQFSMI